MCWEVVKFVGLRRFRELWRRVSGRGRCDRKWPKSLCNSRTGDVPKGIRRKSYPFREKEEEVTVGRWTSAFRPFEGESNIPTCVREFLQKGLAGDGVGSGPILWSRRACREGRQRFLTIKLKVDSPSDRYERYSRTRILSMRGDIGIVCRVTDLESPLHLSYLII